MHIWYCTCIAYKTSMLLLWLPGPLCFYQNVFFRVKFRLWLLLMARWRSLGRQIICLLASHSSVLVVRQQWHYAKKKQTGLLFQVNALRNLGYNNNNVIECCLPVGSSACKRGKLCSLGYIQGVLFLTSWQYHTMLVSFSRVLIGLKFQHRNATLWTAARHLCI